MRTIDMQTWPRREHFKLFNTFNHPIFNMCVNVDVTGLSPLIKQHSYSYTIAMVYLITRVSNEIAEFRYRIRGEQVVEHELVNPSFTFLVDDDIFSFCYLDYVQDFKVFAARGAAEIAAVKTNLNLKNDPNRDDVLYMTPIPWVTFTSFTHPIQLHPGDSVPRFAWGRFFEEGKRLKMPLSVQGHHAVMDGVHMARFYQKFQGYLDQPEAVLGGTCRGSSLPE